jgi:hypothetical protein
VRRIVFLPRRHGAQSEQSFLSLPPESWRSLRPGGFSNASLEFGLNACGRCSLLVHGLHSIVYAPSPFDQNPAHLDRFHPTTLADVPAWHALYNEAQQQKREA